MTANGLIDWTANVRAQSSSPHAQHHAFMVFYASSPCGMCERSNSSSTRIPPTSWMRENSSTSSRTRPSAYWARQRWAFLSPAGVGANRQGSGKPPRLSKWVSAASLVGGWPAAAWGLCSHHSLTEMGCRLTSPKCCATSICWPRQRIECPPPRRLVGCWCGGWVQVPFGFAQGTGCRRWLSGVEAGSRPIPIQSTLPQ